MRWFVQPIPARAERPAARVRHQRARSRSEVSAARTVARPAHAGAVPSRASGRCAGCVPGGTSQLREERLAWSLRRRFSGAISKSWPPIRSRSRRPATRSQRRPSTSPASMTWWPSTVRRSCRSSWTSPTTTPTSLGSGRHAAQLPAYEPVRQQAAERAPGVSRQATQPRPATRCCG
jgi:hypothetical protein